MMIISAVAVTLLSIFASSTQAAQFYTRPKVHPGKYCT